MSSDDEILNVTRGFRGGFETRWFSGSKLRRILTTPRPCCQPCLAAYPNIGSHYALCELSETSSLCTATPEHLHVLTFDGSVYQCPLPSSVNDRAHFSALLAPTVGIIAEISHRSTGKCSYFWSPHPQEDLQPMRELPASHRVSFVSKDLPLLISHDGETWFVWQYFLSSVDSEGDLSANMPDHFADSLDRQASQQRFNSNPSDAQTSAEFLKRELLDGKLDTSATSCGRIVLSQLYRSQSPSRISNDCLEFSSCVTHSDSGDVLLCTLSKHRLIALAVQFSESGVVSLQESFCVEEVASVSSILATRGSENLLDLLIVYRSGRCCLNFGLCEICCVNLTALDRDLQGSDKRVCALKDAVGSRVSIVLENGTALRCCFSTLSISSALVRECMAVISCALMNDDTEEIVSTLQRSLVDGMIGVDYESSRDDWEWTVFVSSLQCFVTSQASFDELLRAKHSAVPSDAWSYLLRSDIHNAMGRSTGLSCCAPSVSAVEGTRRMTHDRTAPLKPPRDVKPSVARVLESLHMLYECKKLDVLSRLDQMRIASCNTELFASFGLVDVADYYVRDCADVCMTSRSVSSPENELSLFDGRIPSVFDWLISIIQRQVVLKKSCAVGESKLSNLQICSEANNCRADSSLLYESAFPLLRGESRIVCPKYNHLHASWRQRSPFHDLRSIENYFLLLFGDFSAVDDALCDLNRPLALLIEMCKNGFGPQDLDKLPCGVSLPLRDALSACRLSDSSELPHPAEILIGREDIAAEMIFGNAKAGPDRDAERGIKDVSSLAANTLTKECCAFLKIQSSAATYDAGIGFESSMPSLRHSLNDLVLQRASDTKNDSTPAHGGNLRGRNASESSSPGGVDANSNIEPDDGCSLDGPVFTLRFGDDRRLNEVARLLRSTEPVLMHPLAPHGNSDDDLDMDRSPELQLKVGRLLARHLASPVGRGAFALRTYRPPDPNMPVSIPSVCLTGKIIGQKGARVKLDLENGLYSTEWGEFHNGAAAGLRLVSMDSGGNGEDIGILARTWILKHRPATATGNASHAGMLLGLGLGGYLPALRTTDYYEYLIPMHDLTSIGLMLGIAAGNRGTMQEKISKMLCVHIRHFNSPGFAVPDFHVSIRVQTAAIYGLGLLYQATGEHHIVEGLLQELSRKPEPGDPTDDREGLALAAGIAIGNVCLGMAAKMPALADLRLQETLILLATGGTDPVRGYSSLTSGKGLFHRKSTHRHLGGDIASVQAASAESETYKIKEGDVINLDVSGPGALLALGMIFLKSNNVNVAERLAIPSTMYALKRTRPDHIYLRCLVKHVILWDHIRPSREWVLNCLPRLLRPPKANRQEDGIDLFRIKDDGTWPDLDADMDEDGILFGRAFAVAGASTALALRFAGSCNSSAINVLSGICRSFEISVRRHEDDNEESEWVYTTCLNSLSLAIAIVAAGSGDLTVLRLLRRLRKRHGPALRELRYGTHMATHMAIGFLFMGGGCQTFGTSNGAVAALLSSVYHRFPNNGRDNRYHLQALRHMYVLAVEPRCIEARDVDTNEPCRVALRLGLSQERGEEWPSEIFLTAPCLVPHCGIIDSVEVVSERYWPKVVRIPLPKNNEGWYSRTGRHVLYVKRRAGCLPYTLDPTGSKGMLVRSFASIKKSSSNDSDANIAHLVCAFHADPSLLAFVRHFCNDRNLPESKSKMYGEILFDCLLQNSPEAVLLYMRVDNAASSVTLAKPCPASIGSLNLLSEYSVAVRDREFSLLQVDFISAAVENARNSLQTRLPMKYVVDYVLSGGQLWPCPRDMSNCAADVVSLMGRFLQLSRVPVPRNLSRLADSLQHISPRGSHRQSSFDETILTVIGTCVPAETPEVAINVLFDALQAAHLRGGAIAR